MMKMINLNKIVTEHIEDEHDKDNWGEGDTDKTYHPSYLGGCNRFLLTCKADIREVNRTLKGIFYIGNRYHELIQSLLNEIEGDVYIEKPVRFDIPNSDLYVKGHADIYHENVVYDIKTVSHKWALNRKQTKPKHKIQVHMYMAGLDAKKGSILYVHKNHFKTKQFAFNYDESIVDETIKRIKRFHPVYMKWKKDGMKLDEIPFEKCGCNYCKYEKLTKNKTD